MDKKEKLIKKIDGKELTGYQIINFKEPTKKATVIPLSKLNQLTPKDISEIVRICNQHDVYELLFKKMLNGKKYQIANAHSFESWANQGWENNSNFTFLIKSDGEKVIGTIDIKTNDPDNAEVGYWMDKDYPGYMTNALVGLITQAKAVGYRSLVAYTKIENNKSKGVLSRAGFQYVGQEERTPGTIRDKFTLSLY